MNQIQQPESDDRKPCRRRSSDLHRRAPVLTFSAYAWIKLQFLCHVGDTEVGAFGVASPDDVLYVEDVVTVKQRCSSVSMKFDDAAVADFFDEQVEAGRAPERFARLWLHTHPGESPMPSGVDEETFERVFGRCSWAVMFILAWGGQTFCRLRVGTVADGRGLAVASVIPVQVDYSTLARIGFATPVGDWIREHDRNVHPAPDLWSAPVNPQGALGKVAAGDDFDAEAWAACFQELDPREQEEILDSLRPRVPAGRGVDDEE